MSEQATKDSPAEGVEQVAMTVWPTIGATAAGQWVGRLCGRREGIGDFCTLGKLFALLTTPVGLAVYAWQLMPWICRRYTLTDRRILTRKGYTAVEDTAIDLDAFDAIEVEVRPGHEWLHAGNLVFRRDGAEVFRLAGVSRPVVFRRVCLTAQQALTSVREVLRQQQEAAVESTAT